MSGVVRGDLRYGYKKTAQRRLDNEKSQPAIFEVEYKSFVINKSDKEKILSQLDTLGINESTLFPEIEHVAKHLKDKL